MRLLFLTVLFTVALLNCKYTFSRTRQASSNGDHITSDALPQLIVETERNKPTEKETKLRVNHASDIVRKENNKVNIKSVTDESLNNIFSKFNAGINSKTKEEVKYMRNKRSVKSDSPKPRTKLQDSRPDVEEWGTTVAASDVAFQKTPPTPVADRLDTKVIDTFSNVTLPFLSIPEDDTNNNSSAFNQTDDFYGNYIYILPPYYNEYNGGKFEYNSGPFMQLQPNEPLTQQNVTDLLAKEVTQAYLNSLVDDIQRIIVTEQLRYCPYTEMCKFSFNLTIPLDFESPCDHCSCKNVDDTMSNTVCPDIMNFTLLRDIQQVDSFICLPMFLKPPVVITYTYKVVSKCPDNSEHTKKERHLCSSGQVQNAFEDIVPVTDTTSNVTYTNKYCALCNNARANSLSFWEPRLECAGRERHTYKTEAELISFAFKTPSCNLEYLPKVTNGVEFCDSVIKTCNETGQWMTFDSVISSACLFYENIYTAQNTDGSDSVKYRNIFCALCNGVTPNSVAFYSFGASHSYAPAIVYSFSGLLRSTKKEAGEQHLDVHCKTGFIYDLQKRECMELLCSPMRNLINDTCQLIYTKVRGVIYIFTAYLYPEKDIKANSNDTIVTFFEFISQFRNALFSDNNEEFSLYYIAEICMETVVERWKQNCSKTLLCTSSNILDHYEVEIHIQITTWHSLLDMLRIVSNMSISNFTVSVMDTPFHFHVEERDIRYSESVMNDSSFYFDTCSDQAEEIRLAHQKSCPLVQLRLSDYDWQEGRSGINFPSLDINLYGSEFHFGINRSTIYICSNTYKQKFLSKIQDIIEGYDVETLLSLVCVSVSLVCLSISFITFCLFPRLRTLPGKTNMSLIMCLLIAQTMFLISSYSRLPRESVECKVMGLLTHFFWLMATFWMNICTFHVFKIFTNIGKVGADKGSLKTFLVYWFYSLVLSTSLVLVNIFISLRRSNNEDFGYGASSCYISSETMIGFTFGIPLGVVVIANLTMFLFTVWQLVKMPDIQKDVKNKRNDVIIFTKLSTLTGFTWVFGFIFSWTGVKVFSYLFILLNASQGVFLFLSFVCNQRVLTMYKTRSFGVTTTSSGSYRTRSTETKFRMDSQAPKIMDKTQEDV